MYSRQQISEKLFNICDHFGLVAYEDFDIDPMVFKFKIEDRQGNVIDTITFDRYHFNKDKLDEIWYKLDEIWDKLSNITPNEPAEKRPFR